MPIKFVYFHKKTEYINYALKFSIPIYIYIYDIPRRRNLFCKHQQNRVALFPVFRVYTTRIYGHRDMR